MRHSITNYNVKTVWWVDYKYKSTRSFNFLYCTAITSDATQAAKRHVSGPPFLCNLRHTAFIHYYEKVLKEAVPASHLRLTSLLCNSCH